MDLGLGVGPGFRPGSGRAPEELAFPVYMCLMFDRRIAKALHFALVT